MDTFQLLPMVCSWGGEEASLCETVYWVVEKKRKKGVTPLPQGVTAKRPKVCVRSHPFFKTPGVCVCALFDILSTFFYK